MGSGLLPENAPPVGSFVVGAQNLVQLNSVTWPARSAGNEKDRSRRTILGGAFPAGGDLTFERESRRGGIQVAP
jgi:hypothetical protein